MTISVIAGLFVLAFRVLNIKLTRITIIMATVIFVLIMTVGFATMILWQGAAPTSHQITLSRFIVALNPDLKALIKTIHVEIGERVNKGDLLFELDKKQFQAAADQYAADLESAKKEVDRLKAALESAGATIKRTVAQREVAKAKRDAQVELRARGSSAVRELQVFRVERDFDAAAAAVLESEASEREAEAAIAAGIAKVKSVRGQLDKASSDLERTPYTAPADGVMINWQARPGSVTTTLRASAVGTFMETANTRIIIVLPQNLLRNVESGDPVEIAFKSMPGNVESAKVIRIANYSGEGQLTAQGDVPVIADIRSRGYFAAIAELDDDELAQRLGLGAAGTAAINTQPWGLIHSLSWLYIRLVSLMYFLP